MMYSSLDPDPTVALFIDYGGLRRSFSQREEQLPDPRELAHAAARKAAAMGRLVVARAYDDWSDNHAGPHAFRDAGIEPRLVVTRPGGAPTALLALGLEAVKHFCTDESAEVALVVAGSAQVAELTLRLRAQARVVIVGPDTELEDGISAGAHQFFTLDELLGQVDQRDSYAIPSVPLSADASQSSGPYDRVAFDPDSYDWPRFVKLVSWLEDRLPFVGVGYLIRKAMNTENVGTMDNREKQAIFQHAQDRGLVEVYYKDNIEQNGDPVAACQLPRDNPAVAQILADLAQQDAGI